MANVQLTENVLLDGYQGIAEAGNLMSEVNDETIWWEYRTGLQSDGYNPVCNRERAAEITLSYSRIGTLPLDPACDDHPALARINRDERQIMGDMA